MCHVAVSSSTSSELSWLRVVVYEGKYRMIRRILHNVGHSVVALRRIRIGDIHLFPPDSQATEEEDEDDDESDADEREEDSDCDSDSDSESDEDENKNSSITKDIHRKPLWPGKVRMCYPQEMEYIQDLIREGKKLQHEKLMKIKLETAKAKETHHLKEEQQREEEEMEENVKGGLKDRKKLLMEAKEEVLLHTKSRGTLSGTNSSSRNSSKTMKGRPEIHEKGLKVQEIDIHSENSKSKKSSLNTKLHGLFGSTTSMTSSNSSNGSNSSSTSITTLTTPNNNASSVSNRWKNEEFNTSRIKQSQSEIELQQRNDRRARNERNNEKGLENESRSGRMQYHRLSDNNLNNSARRVSSRDVEDYHRHEQQPYSSSRRDRLHANSSNPSNRRSERSRNNSRTSENDEWDEEEEWERVKPSEKRQKRRSTTSFEMDSRETSSSKNDSNRFGATIKQSNPRRSSLNF